MFTQQGDINPIFYVFMGFEILLKSVALWRAARANQKWWYIPLFFIASLGILPAVYLLFFQRKAKAVQ